MNIREMFGGKSSLLPHGADASFGSNRRASAETSNQPLLATAAYVRRTVAADLDRYLPENVRRQAQNVHDLEHLLIAPSASEEERRGIVKDIIDEIAGNRPGKGPFWWKELTINAWVVIAEQKKLRAVDDFLAGQFDKAKELDQWTYIWPEEPSKKGGLKFTLPHAIQSLGNYHIILIPTGNITVIDDRPWPIVASRAVQSGEELRNLCISKLGIRMAHPETVFGLAQPSHPNAFNFEDYILAFLDALSTSIGQTTGVVANNLTPQELQLMREGEKFPEERFNADNFVSYWSRQAASDKTRDRVDDIATGKEDIQTMSDAIGLIERVYGLSVVPTLFDIEFDLPETFERTAAARQQAVISRQRAAADTAATKEKLGGYQRLREEYPEAPDTFIQAIIAGGQQQSIHLNMGDLATFVSDLFHGTNRRPDNGETTYYSPDEPVEQKPRQTGTKTPQRPATGTFDSGEEDRVVYVGQASGETRKTKSATTVDVVRAVVMDSNGDRTDIIEGLLQKYPNLTGKQKAIISFILKRSKDRGELGEIIEDPANNSINLDELAREISKCISIK